MSVAPEEPGFFSNLWTKTKQAIAGTTNAVVDTVRPALPAAATDSQVAAGLGLPKEGAGVTMTGGKRYRKTRRHRAKKHRKTGKRKH